MGGGTDSGESAAEGPPGSAARADPGAAIRAASAARADAAARLPDRIAFLGFGLIGGSAALALRDAGYRGTLRAWTPDGRGPAEGARRGLLDLAAPSARAALDGARLVVLAGPPLAAIGTATALGAELRDALADGAVVTDVVSTKSAIVAAADASGLRFVGGHPMAGAETTGIAAATADLFIDRPWVIVPGRAATAADVDRVEDLAIASGARPLRMAADEHDSAVAAISHLPLLVAAAIVESVATWGGGEGWVEARGLAASGWRDMTRLAKGDPEMGAGIIATNVDPIVARLTALRDVLDDWILRIGLEPVAADEIRVRLERARAALEEGAGT